MKHMKEIVDWLKKIFAELEELKKLVAADLKSRKQIG